MVLFALFSIIKVLNYRLHHMYDTGEVVEQDASNSNDEKSDKTGEPSKTSETGHSKALPR